MKTCSKCGLVKDESEFNKDRSRKDRLQCWCKECQRPIIQKWGHEHPEKNREKVSKYKEKNPDKVLAHNTVNNAIRDGKLIRGPCEIKGCEEPSEAHHKDYNKPLEVNWLCKEHHIELHRKERDACN